MKNVTFHKATKQSKSEKGQVSFKGLKKQRSEHGGDIAHPQKRKRPLGLRSTTHLVLRSSKATKKWSFIRNEILVDEILYKFSKKYYVFVINEAKVGNHLHLHLRIPNRKNYRAFIRAVTSAIATGITGYSRWKKAPEGFKFWDQRPFSRIVSTWKEFLNLKKYVEVNRWEGMGVDRGVARSFVNDGWLAPDIEFL